MYKLAAIAALAAVGVVGSAEARKPESPKTSPAPAKCAPNTVGFRASGALISAGLEAEGKGRYHGLLKVNVVRANHHAPTGEQTYTLTRTRVRFHHGVDATAPAAGSRVKLSGSITVLPNKHCSTAGFTPTITIKKIDIKRAKKI